MKKIAIDGPSGAGKSTLSKALAKKLGYVYVDTGAMYRVIGLYILRRGVDPHDEKAVENELPDIKMEIKYVDGTQNMFLNGENVSGLIRTNEVSKYASVTSALPPVRAFLLNVQRDMAKTNNVIMDGRDIGTVIFPDADVKFFVTVSPDARAERRYAELLARGEQTTLDEVKRTMAERDKNDSTRAIAPAIPAEDAVMLDNSGELEQTIAYAMKIIEEKIK